MTTKITLLSYGRTSVNDAWAFFDIGRSRIYYIHSGSCVLKNNTETIELKKGHFYYLPQNFEFLPIKGTIEHFDHSYIDFIALPWQNLTGIIEFDKNSYPTLALAAQLPLSLIDLLKQNDNYSSYRKLIESYISNFMEMIFLEFKIDIEREPEICNALEYIYNHYTQPINIHELATRCHMSTNYFISFFREKVGKSPYRYIKEFRFMQAINMLESGISVKNTAKTIGYTNVSSFSNEFKKLYGFAPSQLLNGEYTQIRKW